MPEPKKPLYEHDEVVILGIDPRGNISFSNGRACETFGYSDEEFLNLRIQDIDPMIPEGAWPEYVDEVPPGAALKFSRRLRRKDGTDFPALVLSHRPKDGDRRCIIGFIHDISANVRTEEALIRAKYVLDRTREQVIISACDGSILYVNDAACRSLGYEQEDLLRMNVCDINPTVTRETFPDKIRGVRDHEAGFFETVHKTRDGRLFPVEIAVTEVVFGEKEQYCAFIRDISDRKRAEEALRESEHLLKRAQEVARLYSFAVDIASNRWSNSDMSKEILGIDDGYPRDFSGWKDLVHPDDWEGLLSSWDQFVVGGSNRYDREFRILRKADGRERWLRSLGELEFDERGAPDRVVGMTMDITERKLKEKEKAALEEQLRQAHKMESVGRLAGGIAHDFNNMLTIILGYSELMRNRIPADDSLRNFLSEIEKAAGHSRDVTSQLLAFSRKQIVAPRVVNLNDLLCEIQNTILRLIGEDIRLLIHPGEDLWDVLIDPAQFNQVLVNLALNARDAMPDGGKLTIATRNGRPDEEERNLPDGTVWASGDCVHLEMTDTGSGMDRETLSHVFEPFFTTKEIGQGTGLGLSTVYGIVRQNHGLIEVRSEPGRGTTFRIRLPRFDGHLTVEAEPGESPEGPAEAVSGTILLVEDEPAVRGLAIRMLEDMRYTVMAAETPLEAVSLLNDGNIAIDLLVTDVTMPGMNGRVLARKAEAARPGIGVLFVSGYPKDLFLKSGLLDEGVHFLSKPFSRRELALAVKGAFAPGWTGAGIP
ncbi:MAG: PAS domain S-box protein [Deltaproteobacteria bacterium]|nr:PAS domain S-box protein [Deltaproteobacteria bacterium]